MTNTMHQPGKPMSRKRFAIILPPHKHEQGDDHGKHDHDRDGKYFTKFVLSLLKLATDYVLARPDSQHNRETKAEHQYIQQQ